MNDFNCYTFGISGFYATNVEYVSRFYGHFSSAKSDMMTRERETDREGERERGKREEEREKISDN